MLASYEAFDYTPIVQAVTQFAIVDLSAFYLDVSKDRLYTFRADAVERRSAQTAQYVIADELCRLVAPVLAMTSDEVWQRLPGARETSVHLAEFSPNLEQWLDADLEARWTQLLDVRGLVNQALEGARQRKEIGSALAASVRVSASGQAAELLERSRGDLPMLFIVSAVDVSHHGSDGLGVEVSHAPGEKCPRCWRFVTTIVADGERAGLCTRCAEALGGVVASGR